MIFSAATERGSVRRFPLSRAPRTVARTAFTLFSALLLLSAVGPATADLLQPTSSTLGAGTTSVSPCGDLSLAALNYDLENGVVIAVSVSGLPATCVGSQLRLALTTTGATATAGPVTVSGTTALLYPLSSNPAYETVTDARLVLVG